jgi:light-regulated signal transduction histidine kinase (bacteriophytochrome)/CheY-like chemotaxis protein
MTVNDPVDLTNCDREPIHIIGTVQSYGFLIAVSSADWVVTRASRNVSKWLDLEADQMIGRALNSFLRGDAIHDIRGHLQTVMMTQTVARAFGLQVTDGGLNCDVAIHVVDDEIVIEFEPSAKNTTNNSGAVVQTMIARLRQAEDLRNFYRAAAREMRALSGFDRVMIYRFDPDGSGEVIAESARSDIGSFLGQRYPASDIPVQARLMYQRNWLRIIPDIDAKPSPIHPALDGKGRPLDLSMSILRSVSPIHIEYLRNMGIQASMSISIMEGGKLWGLFACHHYAPLNVSFDRRTAAELFGQMFSLLMESRERDGEAAYEERGRKLHNRLITAMAGEASRFESIINHLDEIADLLICDGIGLWINGGATVHGLTPTKDQFAGLIEQLNAMSIEDVYSQKDIGSVYPGGKEFAERAAGMMVVPLSRPARDYLIFFRKEVSRTVSWAGDPRKPVTPGPLGDRLTPRKSFEIWRETVEGQSLPWSAADTRIAESLRVSLLEVILRLSDLTEVERERAQQRQELLIAELNHRIRNILGLIRGVISQSRSNSLTIDDFMSVVGGRIQALARAHDQITSENQTPTSLRNLVTAEAGAYLSGATDRLRFTGDDALLEPQAFTTIALVVHELITNSAKYGALSDNRGHVALTTSFDKIGRLTIDWQEHGGPSVKPPTRRGFGSTIIERSIPHDLGGEADVDYKPDGLVARFVIPANCISRSSDAPLQQTALEPASSAPIVAPAHVLLVEDNLIIALDTEMAMLAMGVQTVVIVSNVAAALASIRDKAPDFALLDVNLGAETSIDVAKELKRRGVPFVLATGYGEQVSFGDGFDDVQMIRKPYTADSLRRVMRKQGE